MNYFTYVRNVAYFANLKVCFPFQEKHEFLAKIVEIPKVATQECVR